MEATISHPPFYVYITTNSNKSVLNVHYTHDLAASLKADEADAKGSQKTFAGKTACYQLLYYTQFEFAVDAIFRVMELKSWSRKKREAFITSHNPTWSILSHNLTPNSQIIPA
jgi:predicted GIY-YIG superfamily endonuclease